MNLQDGLEPLAVDEREELLGLVQVDALLANRLGLLNQPNRVVSHGQVGRWCLLLLSERERGHSVVVVVAVNSSTTKT